MKLKKYITTYRISMRNALYYRKNIAGGVIMYSLYIYVFFLLWKVIYKGDTIAGYTFSQMIWYICITEVIKMSMGVGTFHQMGQEIKNGSIAYQLGRPYHYILYQFSNNMGKTAVNLVMFSMIAVVVGFILVGAPQIATAVMIPFFIISVILSLALQFFVMMSIGLTAFYVEENRPFFFIYSKLVLMLGTFIPIEFFPEWMQSILKFLPFSLVTWAPAKMFVAFSMEHALFVIPAQAIWVLIFIGISMTIYNKGVKQIHVNGG